MNEQRKLVASLLGNEYTEGPELLDADTSRPEGGRDIRIKGYNAGEVAHKPGEQDDPNARLATEAVRALLQQGGAIELTGERDYSGKRDMGILRREDGRDAAGDIITAGLAAASQGDLSGQLNETTNIARRALGLDATNDPTLKPFADARSDELQGASETVYTSSYDKRNPFHRSWDRGLEQLDSSIGGLQNWTGELTGNAELAEAGKERRAAADHRASLNARRVEDFTQIESLSDLGTYLAESVGEMAPGLVMDTGLAAAGAVTGGASWGAIAARRGGTMAVKAGIKRGAQAGAAASAGVQSLGAMENTLDAQKDGVHTGAAALSGVAGAVLSVASEGIIIGKMLKSAGISDEAAEKTVQTISERFKDVVDTSWKGGALEGVTSFAQIVTDKLIETQALDKEWDLKTVQTIDDTIRAVIGGTAASGAGSAGANTVGHIMDTYSGAREAALDEQKKKGEGWVDQKAEAEKNTKATYENSDAKQGEAGDKPAEPALPERAQKIKAILEDPETGENRPLAEILPYFSDDPEKNPDGFTLEELGHYVSYRDPNATRYGDVSDERKVENFVGLAQKLRMAISENDGEGLLSSGYTYRLRNNPTHKANILEELDRAIESRGDYHAMLARDAEYDDRLAPDPTESGRPITDRERAEAINALLDSLYFKKEKQGIFEASRVLDGAKMYGERFGYSTKKAVKEDTGTTIRAAMQERRTVKKNEGEKNAKRIKELKAGIKARKTVTAADHLAESVSEAKATGRDAARALKTEIVHEAMTKVKPDSKTALKIKQMGRHLEEVAWAGTKEKEVGVLLHYAHQYGVDTNLKGRELYDAVYDRILDKQTEYLVDQELVDRGELDIAVEQTRVDEYGEERSVGDVQDITEGTEFDDIREIEHNYKQRISQDAAVIQQMIADDPKLGELGLKQLWKEMASPNELEQALGLKHDQYDKSVGAPYRVNIQGKTKVETTQQRDSHIDGKNLRVASGKTVSNLDLAEHKLSAKTRKTLIEAMKDGRKEEAMQILRELGLGQDRYDLSGLTRLSDSKRVLGMITDRRKPVAKGVSNVEFVMTDANGNERAVEIPAHVITKFGAEELGIDLHGEDRRGSDGKDKNFRRLLAEMFHAGLSRIADASDDTASFSMFPGRDLPGHTVVFTDSTGTRHTLEQVRRAHEKSAHFDNANISIEGARNALERAEQLYNWGQVDHDKREGFLDYLHEAQDIMEELDKSERITDLKLKNAALNRLADLINDLELYEQKQTAEGDHQIDRAKVETEEREDIDLNGNARYAASRRKKQDENKNKTENKNKPKREYGNDKDLKRVVKDLQRQVEKLTKLLTPPEPKKPSDDPVQALIDMAPAAVPKSQDTPKAELQRQVNKIVKRAWNPNLVAKTIERVFHSARSQMELRNYTLAEALFTRSGNGVVGGSFERNRRMLAEQYTAKIDNLLGGKPKDVEAAFKDAQGGKPKTEQGKKLLEIINKLHEEVRAANPTYRGEGIPVTLDYTAIDRNRKGFMAVLTKHKVENPREFMEAVLTSGGTADHAITAGPNRPAGTRRSNSELRAAMADLRAAGFVDSDPYSSLTHFVQSAASYASWHDIFSSRKNGGFAENAFFDKLIEDTHPADLDRVMRIVDTVTGRAAAEAHPMWNRINSISFGITAASVLLFSGVASLPELVTASTRTRGDIEGVNKSVLKAVTPILSNRSELYDLARAFETSAGSIAQQTVMDLYLGNHLSVGKLSAKISGTMFKINGQQKVTEISRALATHMGRDFLYHHAKKAAEGDERSIRSLKELNVTFEDVQKFRAEERAGTRDFESKHGKAFRNALHQFVDESVTNPHKGQMPVWMSDPRFQLVATLKKFFYGYWDNFHRQLGSEYKKRGSEDMPAHIFGMAMTAALLVPLAGIAELLRELWKYPLGRSESGVTAGKVALATGGLGPLQAVESIYEQTGYGRNMITATISPAVGMVFDAVTGNGKASQWMGPVNQTPWLRKPIDEAVRSMGSEQ